MFYYINKIKLTNKCENIKCEKVIYNILITFCKIKIIFSLGLIHFIKPPNITDLSYQQVTIVANINDETVIGVGRPSSFIVQSKVSYSVYFFKKCYQFIYLVSLHEMSFLAALLMN